MAQIGVITEQNDLGLGFDPLSQKDEKAYNESANNSDKHNEADNK